MLRSLIQKKENLRGLMSELWKVKEQGKDWSREQREQYDKHHEQVKKLDDDIKLRSEYVESFQASLPKADKDFNKLQKRASIFNIIKRELFDATKDSRFKVDEGPIAEVIQERSKNIDSQFIRPGEIPVPLNEFGKGLETRATVTTATGVGADLVEETIYPQIVPNLYAKAWCGRAGCTLIENWRGDFILPAEDTEPASGFIAETAEYPESSIDYKQAFVLKPLKVGALQPFSLQSFMQDETRQLQSSINMQLMKEWAKKVDDDFLNSDGSVTTTPKGILEITGIQTLDTGSSANGDALTFAKCIESEGKLTENNQDMPPVWVLNAQTVTHARSTLRNSVAGSLYIGTTRRFADRRFVQTNVVSSKLTKGSASDLSGAVLLVAESVVVVNWSMPTVSIDRSIGFKSDTVWTKISGYTNIGLKRPKDVVYLKNIKTS